MNLLNNYRTRTFTDVFPLVDDFLDFYENCGMPTKMYTVSSGVTDKSSMETLYYLLCARYANSHVSSSDENRFKFEVMSIIFEYGLAWKKQIEIQDKLATTDIDTLRKGTKAVYNTALNPEGEPGTGSTEELSYINQQNTTNYDKGLLELFDQVKSIINTNVTEVFLDKFKRLFTRFPAEKPIWYVTEVEEE